MLRQRTGVPALSVLIVLLTAMLAACDGSQAPSSVSAGQQLINQTPRSDQSASQHNPAPAGPRVPRPPIPWWGVTVDSLDNLDATVVAIAEMPVPPVVRLVFDLGEEPTAYRSAVARLSEHASVIGLVVDSASFVELPVDQYRARFQTYVGMFGAQIGLWEIGNEVNGEWLGQPSEVVQAITGADQIVRSKGLTPVLTLYYNPGCFDDQAHDMFNWVQQQLSSEFRNSLPYVLLSYYPDQCGGRWPTQSEWNTTFDRVGLLFPHSLLGIGEAGIAGDAGSVAAKVNLVNEFYGLKVQSDRYIGGFFWWYFAEDAVPHVGNPVWNAMANKILER